MQRTITISDVELQVEYSATEYRPATFHEPAEGGEVEIEGVYLDGNEVGHMLADWVEARILEQLRSGIAEDQHQAEEDEAEAKAESRAAMRDMLEEA